MSPSRSGASRNLFIVQRLIGLICIALGSVVLAVVNLV